ncbi:hypothetical protein M3689_17655 [Alkalihalophilus marmarensis]|jgi:hypothetical protein|uniref:Uncharacterized protein n=1 Tax=Alkalihalophilus marmarensis DSM 21297 TaxID=1188261 RepID=U6SQT2_9BACI|nr:hypothetical protein [Alkalihalophilus marmarensis]ERN53958.1 hypothetical protein A33I_09140 [Alkalihalophilus marmarensis DSM 21297]MCM3491128.1 hypothetical protein [Alkalihalophilus marmarensis]
MDKTIVIEFQTREEYCRCCDQKLATPKTSEVREFEFDKADIMSWGNWKEISMIEEDLRESVKDYVCETISFLAISPFEKLLIEESEFDKVKKFVTNEILI